MLDAVSLKKRLLLANGLHKPFFHGCDIPDHGIFIDSVYGQFLIDVEYFRVQAKYVEQFSSVVL
jgi:hypothetical protein